MEILNKKLKLFQTGLNKNTKTPSERNHKNVFAMNTKYIIHLCVHSLNGSESITYLDNIDNNFITWISWTFRQKEMSFCFTD